MAFRDILQPASFRGVPFHVPTAETIVGRRVVVHEFPSKDKPLPEDLGKRADGFMVEGFIIGDDYVSGMKRLIAALKTAGPATLVHPTLGSLQVVLVDSVNLREQFIERRGMVSFSLRFVEAGDDLQPSTVVDTQQAVEDAADNTYASIESDFASKFSIDGAPAWSVQSITDRISGVSDTLASVRNGLSLDFTSLSTLNRMGSMFKSNLVGLLAKPGDLASQLTTQVRGIVGLFDFSAAQSSIFGGLGISSSQSFGTGGHAMKPITALLPLADYGQPGSATAQPAIPTNTPVRRQQAANQEALFSLIGRSVVVEAVRSSTYVPFDSADQSAALRDQLYDALDGLMLDASDDVYDALRDLRCAMVTDITERGADRMQLSAITLPGSVPAQVLSYRMYGTGAYAAEIVARNQAAGTVLHPLFLPAGTSLEVRRV